MQQGLHGCINYCFLVSKEAPCLCCTLVLLCKRSQWGPHAKLYVKPCRDGRDEPQRAGEYKTWWTEQLKAAAARLRQPWPAGVKDRHWLHATGIAPIKFQHKSCDFPLSSKNDMILCFAGINNNAILGVAIKKKLTDQVGSRTRWARLSDCSNFVDVELWAL
jgi:hypothetical protein